MSKKPKKRNKPYQGTDAKIQAPTVHRYQAVVRSPLSEWWHDHKRMVKIIASVAGVALILGWLVVEMFGMIF